MTVTSEVDRASGRKWYLDQPADEADGLTFVLSLHGGGSFGQWQRDYFPLKDHVDSHALVVATPTALTAEPMRFWAGDADDAHLHAVVSDVHDRFGDRIRAMWLAGHSQGGLTSFRLLKSPFFLDRVDGFVSLSGGRIGQAPLAPDFGPPRAPGEPRLFEGRPPPAPRDPNKVPKGEFSFIYTSGEHEIASLPETSPWAASLGAGDRVRLDDVIDTEGGQTYDQGREGRSSKSWGLLPGPGRAEVYTYPGAPGGQVIADVVRLGKGHTEGLEPKVTERIVDLMVGAPGGGASR